VQQLYCINGEEPQLIGERCTGFVLDHFYEGHQITDQVNVAHFCFGEQWYRLYFECGTIFWRASNKPEAAQNAGLGFGLLLNDLFEMEGIVGGIVAQVVYEATEGGDVRATIRFTGGRSLIFAYSCEGDSTQLVA
jgi:hypothetical protein